MIIMSDSTTFYSQNRKFLWWKNKSQQKASYTLKISIIELRSKCNIVNKHYEKIQLEQGSTDLKIFENLPGKKHISVESKSKSVFFGGGNQMFGGTLVENKGKQYKITRHERKIGKFTGKLQIIRKKSKNELKFN